MHCSAILYFFSVDTRVRRELAHVSTCIYKKAAKLLSGFSPGQNLQSPSLYYVYLCLFGSFWIILDQLQRIGEFGFRFRRRTSQNIAEPEEEFHVEL